MKFAAAVAFLALNASPAAGATPNDTPVEYAFHCGDFGGGYLTVGPTMSLVIQMHNLTPLGLSGNLESLNYHLHTKWDQSPYAKYSTSQCGSAYTGGHYDPTFACGPASQAKGTPDCADAPQYMCNWDSGDIVGCELGDLSGKFGPLTVAGDGSASLTSYNNDVDDRPPINSEFMSKATAANPSEWSSIVFHEGPTRVLCCEIFPYYGGGKGMGDPHFNTWSNEWYDFHGVCDLVFLRNEKFSNGKGLDIHIRTKGKYDYSYIEAASIKIGEDVVEIGSYGEYWVNGVEGVEMPITIGGYTMTNTHLNKSDRPLRTRFVITTDEDKGEAIVVSTFKDLMSVEVQNSTIANFGDSEGMMGRYVDGKLVARDGKTVMDDLNAFGQEWQVLASEPELFQSPSPYLGGTCVPPVSKGRRLGESKISTEAAEMACAQHEGGDKDRCIFDVIAMQDLDVAEIHGAF